MSGCLILNKYIFVQQTTLCVLLLCCPGVNVGAPRAKGIYCFESENSGDAVCLEYKEDGANG